MDCKRLTCMFALLLVMAVTSTGQIRKVPFEGWFVVGCDKQDVVDYCTRGFTDKLYIVPDFMTSSGFVPVRCHEGPDSILPVDRYMSSFHSDSLFYFPRVPDNFKKYTDVDDGFPFSIWSVHFDEPFYELPEEEERLYQFRYLTGFMDVYQLSDFSDSNEAERLYDNRNWRGKPTGAEVFMFVNEISTVDCTKVPFREAKSFNQDIMKIIGTSETKEEIFILVRNQMGDWHRVAKNKDELTKEEIKDLRTHFRKGKLVSMDSEKNLQIVHPFWERKCRKVGRVF